MVLQWIYDLGPTDLFFRKVSEFNLWKLLCSTHSKPDVVNFITRLYAFILSLGPNIRLGPFILIITNNSIPERKKIEPYTPRNGSCTTKFRITRIIPSIRKVPTDLSFLQISMNLRRELGSSVSFTTQVSS